MGEQLYFAYGSNMNLDQMEFRCPAASVVGNVRLENYRLTFCGVATILPEEGSHVDGVLWKLTKECEKSLDRYEGYPRLYGKEMIHVKDKDGNEIEVMAYTMNSPYKDRLSRPSKVYVDGILEGCRQNGIRMKNVKEAVKRSCAEQKAEVSAARRRKQVRER